jgi:mannose-1-phosphate guanylyltransferase / mannose-6-phosphate isomerase
MRYDSLLTESTPNTKVEPIVQPVILCGGSGTRLWPLSRKAFPKQFVPLIDGKSLLALTLERVAPLTDKFTGVVCVGAEEHRFLVLEAIAGAQLGGTIILEPVARNTAAAMALAALNARSPEQLLLFCPSDHHIPDVAAFTAMVRGAVACAQQGTIVAFGVLPTFPSTAYGYIEKGAQRTDLGFPVSRFIEKPSARRAEQLLLAGNVLWNAGIFLCTAGTLIAALERHAPDILANCREAMVNAKHDDDFLRPAATPLEHCRAESIDYAVMERDAGVVVFPFESLWSDVGSWGAVADMCPSDEHGNRVEGRGLAIDAKNNFVHAPYRCVVALGVEDLLIVDTPDALLVTTRGSAE